MCCSWALKWLFTWRSNPVCDVNRAPQPATIHLNGLSPLWLKMCLSSQDFEHEDLSYTLQPFHKHTNVSFLLCGNTWHMRMWSIISWFSRVLSQSFHWHSVGMSLQGVSLPPGLGATLQDTGVHDLEVSGVSDTIPLLPLPLTRGSNSLISLVWGTLKRKFSVITRIHIHVP